MDGPGRRRRCPRLSSVVVGLLSCVSLGCPLTFCIGINVLFSEWMTSFGTSRAATGAVQAACVGLTAGGGLVAALCERKLGARVSLVLGSVLATAGLFSGAFAPSLLFLIMTVGVCTGMGFSLIHLCTLSTAMTRFASHSVMISSAMSTTSEPQRRVGPTRARYLVELPSGPLSFGLEVPERYLSEEYTWRCCLMFVAGMMLHTVLVGLLITSPLLRAAPTQRTPPAHHLHQVSLEINSLLPPPPPPPRTSVNYHLHDDQNESDDKTRKLNPPSRKDCPKEYFSSVDLKQERALIGIITITADTDNNKRSSRTESLDTVVWESLNRLNKKSDQRDDVSLSADVDVIIDNSKIVGLLPLANGESKEQKTAAVEPTTATTTTAKTMTRTARQSQWTFLKNPVYLLVVAVFGFTVGSQISVIILLLDLAQSKGWTTDDGIVMSLAFMFGSLTGRALLGAASLSSRLNGVVLLAIAGLVGALGMTPLALVEDFYLMCWQLFLTGNSFGALFGIHPAAVLFVTGPKSYPLAQGLISTAEGLVDFSFGVLTGMIVDHVQSYVPPCVLYGLTSFTLSVILIVLLKCSHKAPETRPETSSIIQPTVCG